MFVTPKFCISIVFSFSWGHFNSQEKLKTMLMQNLGVTNKNIMVCYGIFWSGQLLFSIPFCKYVWRWKESWRYHIQDVLDGLGWYIFSILPLGSWARMKSKRVSITDHSFHTFIEWRRFLFLSDAACFYPPPPLFPKRQV